jgi:TonB family protein
MESNRVFKITLIISFCVHGAILLSNPNLNVFPKQKPEQKMEVSYVRPPEEKARELKVQSLKSEPFLKIPSKITADRRIPPPFVDKENIFKINKSVSLEQARLNKPTTLLKPDVIAVKKKITLPPVDMDKINNSSYISYYQIVREKIRRSAYQNYTSSETGEAYLSFVVSSDGQLKDVRLSEEKSSPNAYLKQIALRSIRDASPFPAFPKELDYPRLSFNVVISFEIE